VKKRFSFLALAAGAVGLLLYLPMLAILAASVRPPASSAPEEGFTLGAYQAVFRNAEILAALKNSLIVGAASTALAVVLGTALGCGLARPSIRGRNAAEKLLVFSMATPDIVLAVALLLFYALLRSWIGWFNLGLTTMILAHVTFQIPFVALAVRSRLRGFDPALEEAAHDLGATRARRFWHVTLPLLRPGILAGALLAFTLSLDDFVVSFFTSGPGSTTLPVYIYSSVKRGLSGEIHALSSLLVLAALTGTAGVFWLQGRQEAGEEKKD